VESHHSRTYPVLQSHACRIAAHWVCCSPHPVQRVRGITTDDWQLVNQNALTLVGLGLSLSDSLRSLACTWQAVLLRSPVPPTLRSRAPSVVGFPGPTGSALRLSRPLSGLRRPATARPCLMPLTSMGFLSRPLEFFSLAGPSSSRTRFLPCRYGSPDGSHQLRLVSLTNGADWILADPIPGAGFSSELFLRRSPASPLSVSRQSPSRRPLPKWPGRPLPRDDPSPR
jgi:hypothetical protein